LKGESEGGKVKQKESKEEEEARVCTKASSHKIIGNLIGVKVLYLSM